MVRLLVMVMSVKLLMMIVVDDDRLLMMARMIQIASQCFHC